MLHPGSLRRQHSPASCGGHLRVSNQGENTGLCWDGMKWTGQCLPYMLALETPLVTWLHPHPHPLQPEALSLLTSSLSSSTTDSLSTKDLSQKKVPLPIPASSSKHPVCWVLWRDGALRWGPWISILLSGINHTAYLVPEAACCKGQAAWPRAEWLARPVAGVHPCQGTVGVHLPPTLPPAATFPLQEAFCPWYDITGSGPPCSCKQPPPSKSSACTQ